MDRGKIKKQLYEACRTYVQTKIKTAKDAISMAQSSANEDSKSSMGDKYETGRAMAQLEIEKNTVQMHEFARMGQELERISIEKNGEQAQKGSLIYTSHGTYFLALGAGQIALDGDIYFAVSVLSPIGSILLGTKEGDEIQFNGKQMKILELA